jgi:hypothetical protein
VVKSVRRAVNAAHLTFWAGVTGRVYEGCIQPQEYQHFDKLSQALISGEQIDDRISVHMFAGLV